MEPASKLHNSASQKAQSAAIAIGTVGALILGTGMSFSMTDIGAVLGPCPGAGHYCRTGGPGDGGPCLPGVQPDLKTERQRIAPEILLTDELMKCKYINYCQMALPANTHVVRR